MLCSFDFNYSKVIAFFPLKLFKIQYIFIYLISFIPEFNKQRVDKCSLQYLVAMLFLCLAEGWILFMFAGLSVRVTNSGCLNKLMNRWTKLCFV